MPSYCIEVDYWPEWVEVTYDGVTSKYFVERTCHYVDDDGLMGTCSSCGEPMGEAHHFCPWCGAKVVK